MKLLHITATHLNQEGGIPAVLRNLVKYQNTITGMNSKVLAIKKNVTRINDEHFDYVTDYHLISKYIYDYSPDIVIIHSVYFFRYYYIEKILRKNNVKYFIEPHGSFGRIAQKKSKWKKQIVNNTLLYRFIKNAEGYIFLNEGEKENSVFRKKHEFIIPNGMDKIIKINNDFKFSESEKDILFIYFIGRFDITYKGIDILLDAIDIIDKEKENISITFFGIGNKKEENYLDNRIKNLKYIDAKKHGPIYGKEKEQFLSQYDAMILTSRSEGFPMTVLEAWSYGVPCLVTKGTNMGDVVQTEKIGYLLGDTPQQIACDILNFKKDYIINKQNYGIRSQDYIKENCLWSQIAEQSYKQFSVFLKAKRL